MSTILNGLALGLAPPKLQGVIMVEGARLKM